jgi:hypothetical protein
MEEIGAAPGARALGSGPRELHRPAPGNLEATITRLVRAMFVPTGAPPVARDQRYVFHTARHL